MNSIIPTSRTKILVIIILALLTALAFVGCRSRVNKVTNIRFVSWGNEVEEKNLRSLIAEFEKQNPDIKVELEIIPWVRVFDKLMISTAGGRPPDVTRLSSTWSAPLAAKGLLEPLDDYVKRDDYDLQDFFPQSLDGWGRYKGTLYSIPTDIDVYAMYYNKTMFDKYGVPYPDWTWDWNKYVEMSKLLTKDLNGDGNLDQWGCATDVWWQSYIYQSGGTIVSDDNSQCTLDKPEAYRGLQFMSDLLNKHHVAPRPEETAQVGNMKLFTSGKIGMFISGSWAAELIFPANIKDFEYDVAPLPRGPRSRATFIGGAAYGILSRSQHKEASWKLVKWMTGKEYQRSRALESQIIPSRISVAKETYLSLKKPPLHRKAFVDMIAYGRATPYVSCSPEMNEIIQSRLELVLLGKKSAKSACEEVTPIVDELLRHRE